MQRYKNLQEAPHLIDNKLSLKSKKSTLLQRSQLYSKSAMRLKYFVPLPDLSKQFTHPMFAPYHK